MAVGFNNLKLELETEIVLNLFLNLASMRISVLIRFVLINSEWSKCIQPKNCLINMLL